jgi:hypothetical protein
MEPSDRLARRAYIERLNVKAMRDYQEHLRLLQPLAGKLASKYTLRRFEECESQ